MNKYNRIGLGAMIFGHAIISLPENENTFVLVMIGIVMLLAGFLLLHAD